MEFFTPNELSRILKLHPFTVTRLAREGKLPGFKVGGIWRFRKDEFERWIEDRTNGKAKQIRRYNLGTPPAFLIRHTNKNSNTT